MGTCRDCNFKSNGLFTQALKASVQAALMQSSHVNEIELAQLMPSFEKVNKAKSSGLNHSVGRAFSHLLLLLPVCMFTARLMKFSHGTCFLSAPTL